MNTPRTTFYEDFSIAEFPSPIGVNHYEFSGEATTLKTLIYSFRPQQGLTIMNHGNTNGLVKHYYACSFRPQQGLTIMNNINKLRLETYKNLHKVSVPNRG